MQRISHSASKVFSFLSAVVIAIVFGSANGTATASASAIIISAQCQSEQTKILKNSVATTEATRYVACLRLSVTTAQVDECTREATTLDLAAFNNFGMVCIQQAGGVLDKGVTFRVKCRGTAGLDFTRNDDFRRSIGRLPIDLETVSTWTNISRSGVPKRNKAKDGPQHCQKAVDARTNRSRRTQKQTLDLQFWRYRHGNSPTLSPNPPWSRAKLSTNATEHWNIVVCAEISLQAKTDSKMKISDNCTINSAERDLETVSTWTNISRSGVTKRNKAKDGPQHCQKAVDARTNRSRRTQKQTLDLQFWRYRHGNSPTFSPNPPWSRAKQLEKQNSTGRLSYAPISGFKPQRTQKQT
jgi:hypothetical protein